MIIPIFPLLFLMTALISIVLYQRSNQEIYLVLAIASGIIFVIWGLTLSHWLIHLLCLLALVSLRIPVFQPKTVNIYRNR